MYRDKMPALPATYRSWLVLASQPTDATGRWSLGRGEWVEGGGGKRLPLTRPMTSLQ